MKSTMSFLAIMGMATLLNAAVQRNFYVDPAGNDANDGTSASHALKSLARAQQAVLALTPGMTGDIVINLRGGMHLLSDSLVFVTADGGSGDHYVVYQSYPGERAVISGGRIITGWSLDPSKGLYRANVGTSINSRNFFVSGIRCPRAASERWYCSIETSPFEFDDDNGGMVHLPSSGPYAAMGTWRNIRDIEFSFGTNWQNHRVRISSISGTTATLVSPAGGYLARSTGPVNCVFQVANAFELLDMPGEWYHDRTSGILWYKPRHGEDMTRDTAVLADLPTAIRGTGVRNLKFQNLQFSYFDFKRIANPNNWCYVGRWGSGFMDYPGWDLRKHQWQETHVWFENSRNIVFERNVFSHLGSYAFRSNRGNRNITLIGNVFTDLGGGGVSFGSTYGSSETDPDSNILCSNNYFEDFANDFYDNVAIYSNYVKTATFSNNEIINAPYAGFLLRGTPEFPELKVDFNLTAKNNRIIGYVGNPVLKDGGAFYFCGALPGPGISDNFMQRGGYAALYCDIAAANLTVSRNVVECMRDYANTEFLPFNNNYWAYIWNEYCHDIAYDGNYTNWNRSANITSGPRCVIRNTVHEPAALWPVTLWSNQTARGIVANSGLEPAYADIRPDYGRNLAKGKTVTASSSEESSAWGKNFLVDGTTLSTTTSAIGYSSAVGTGAWVQVDLGASHSINRIVLWPRQDYGPGNRAGCNYPRDFRIEVSSDAATWITVVQEEGAAKADFHGMAYRFPAIGARYVRLTATTLRNELSIGSRLHLAEMEIFGTAAPVTSHPGTYRLTSGIGISLRKGVLTISNPALGPVRVRIHDTAGRLVASARPGSDAIIRIRAESLCRSPGHYIAGMEASGSQVTRRILVEQ